MQFRCLFEMNEDWSADQDLLMLVEADRSFFRAKTAVALYGSRRVLWFYKDVVMLE